MKMGKVGKRLILIVGASLLGMVILSTVALSTLNQVKIKGKIYNNIILGKDLVADILPPPEYILESYLVMMQMKQAVNADVTKALIEKSKTLKKDFEDRHKYWLENLKEGAIKTMIVETSYVPAKKFYDILESQYIPAIVVNDTQSIERSERGLEEQYALHRKAIDDLVALVNKENSEIEQQAVALINARYFWFGIIGIIVLFGVIGISIFVIVNISGYLLRNSNSLSEGAEQTASAASQVSSAAQQLSQGATEQAASLEQTSGSLEEINTMTKQNTDSASMANQLTQESRRFIEEGNVAMSELQKAMGGINESSNKVSKIIKTIEEVAFQTNLLALNAAVEAARAGEHGKGFAVVAEEVRNLAKRSAEAAKDTTSLIEDSIIKTKEGSEISKKMGEFLIKITEHIKKVADIVSEIFTASKEQANGINQVTNAVNQMDQVVQQNASSAEEVAASAEELNSQVETMRCAISDLVNLVSGKTSDAQTEEFVNSTQKRVVYLSKSSMDKPVFEKREGPKIITPENEVL